MNAVKKLHSHLIVTGLYRHPSSPISQVLISYALSPSLLSHAISLFHQIHHPNTLHYNTIIRGYAHHGIPAEAIAYYASMRAHSVSLDNRTFPFVLKACSSIAALSEGQWIHTHALKFGFCSDIYVSNALIHLYSSCGHLDVATMVFDEMPVRDLVSWNSLICGYFQLDRLREVLHFFNAMQADGVVADKVTMVKVVCTCTNLEDWGLGDSMVKYIEENGVEIDVYLGNTLIDYFGRRGYVDSAWKIFAGMKEKNIVTDNSMIMTLAKAGDFVSARRIFDRMQNRDLITWSSMIVGYSQSNRSSDALQLFGEMQRANVKPDEIVIASVISCCASSSALDLGRWIDNFIKENEITMDVYVGNALIDMYSKCGIIVDALRVFNAMKEKDALSWNLIILGLATNGYVESAIEVFSVMLRNGVQLNELSFLGVILACVHGGLVEKGLGYFKSMKEVYGLVPEMKHYGCVVDLLGRAGDLNEAQRFILEMPMQPDPIIWRTLLGACKEHGNMGLAEIATQKLMKLDPSNSGNYVLLANTYASADRWEDAMKMREEITETDVQKIPAHSSIELNDMIQAAMN